MERELDGVAKAYRAPAADRDDGEEGAVAREAPNYVVSPTKLVLLFVASLGLYTVYWFYRHWQRQKQVGTSRIWPWARAILSVFYVAPLFKRLDSDARRAGHAPSWSPTAQAALFIVAHVAGRGMEMVSRLGEGSTVLAVSSLLVLQLRVIPLLKAQQLVNTSVGDPRGARNSQLGTGGVVVLLVGALAWPLLIVARFGRPD